MDEKVKHRMIGAAVFFALAVIFVPMLFEESLKPADQPTLQEVKIPQQPKPFESQIVSLGKPKTAAPVELPVTTTSIPSPVELPATEAITEVVIPPEPLQPAPKTIPPETTASKTPTNIPSNAWMIQVGSFGSEANAHGLANELQKSGFKAFVELIQGNNGASLYRVAVGPQAGRGNAESIRDSLLQKMGMKTLIKPYVQ